MALKTIVTGMHGTVAPVLAAVLAAQGDEVVPWDRERVPVDDPAAGRRFLTGADVVFHLATGSVEWAETIARICAAEGIGLLYASSVAVFSSAQAGPFGVERKPEPTDDYGRYKLACEERILAACPDARVARLGWQIGDVRGSNNMIEFLWRAAETEGRIVAATTWIPSCAFLADTAEALRRLATGPFAGGVHHLEGNPGLSFHEIAERLRRRHQAPWRIVAGDEPVWDQRLSDERISVASIAGRL